MNEIRREHEISPADAALRRRDDESYLILDCRLPEEHEVSRIAGSLLIPLHEIEQRLDEIEDALEEREQARDASFAVLCHHGVRSLRAALMLQQHGFTGARSISGGIERWSAEVDPEVPRYTRDGPRCRIVS